MQFALALQFPVHYVFTGQKEVENERKAFGNNDENASAGKYNLPAEGEMKETLQSYMWYK